MGRRAIALCVVALSITFISGVTGKADVRRGEHFAEQWCGVCHGVLPNQASPRPNAPSFSTLAADPTVNDASLRTFLRTTPHRAMPKLKLSRVDLDDVVAYILSLRGR